MGAGVWTGSALGHLLLEEDLSGGQVGLLLAGTVAGALAMFLAGLSPNVPFGSGVEVVDDEHLLVVVGVDAGQGEGEGEDGE